jgi:N-acetyl-anhydromuramyl-L-alanine amidase AmpD
MITKFIPTTFKKPRGSNPIDTVVIHHIGSNNGKLYSTKGTITWFTNEDVHRNKETGKIENIVSAHYVIPREPYDGADIIKIAEHSDITYHAGRSEWTYKDGTTKKWLNKNSIGIELAGDGNFVEYTEFQYRVLIELLKEIMDKHNIPVENIVGHEDVSPGRKVDPGKHFDWDRVRKALNTTSIVIDEPLVVTADKPVAIEEEDDDNFSMSDGTDGFLDRKEAIANITKKPSPLLAILDILRGIFKVIVNKK